jgi:hypothetical protein
VFEKNVGEEYMGLRKKNEKVRWRKLLDEEFYNFYLHQN